MGEGRTENDLTSGSIASTRRAFAGFGLGVGGKVRLVGLGGIANTLGSVCS
jgi:hypothetical protein